MASHRSLLAWALLSALLLVPACSTCRRTPAPDEKVYREAVTAFHTGLAAMQTTQEVLARQKLDQVTTLVPDEPAGWANLGLLLLRQQELDAGAKALARAASLAPDSPEIARLQALASSRQGNLPEAIGHWRRTLELDPNDLEAAYALALETERQGGESNERDAQRLLAQLLGRQDNLAARIEYVRLAAKRGDGAALTSAVEPLAAAARTWSPDARAQLDSVLDAAADNPRAAATRVAFLKNYLLREPVYRAALADVSTPREEVGRPLTHFARLKNPDPQPAPADTSLAFSLDVPAGAAPGASWVGAVHLTGEGGAVVASAGPTGVSVSDAIPGALGRGVLAPESGLATPDAVAAADLNYDFRTDLAIAGPGGVRLLRQGVTATFTDVTAEATLPSALRAAAAHGIWDADADTDGDLDLVLALRDSPPVLLRNNGDGTFAVREPFAGVPRARGFVWADIDGEGVPDAAFLDDQGRLHVFQNLRGGVFQAMTGAVSQGSSGQAAIAVAEVTGDSLFDLLILGTDGGIARLSRRTTDGQWDGPHQIARADGLAGLEAGRARLLAADLDNNGAVDLVAAGPRGSRVLLGAPGGKYAPLAAPLDVGVQAAADLDGNGRLELVGLGPDGQPRRATSRGAAQYHYQVVRTRAATATGDQRINPFGIGGEVEVRSGLHVQKRPIAAPVVHFGLGTSRGAEIARIVWPNGALQSEFDTRADTTVLATQRLKGSCPWLFAWNGREMAFVTDVIWRSPLGLRINAQATADVLMTEDRVKVRGDQVAARDGVYDLRITAELWETHFFDLTSLMVVDHPEGTEVFVDERFAVPPPGLDVVATGPVQPMRAVRDDRGADVSALARARDSRHLDFAGRGPFQGITRRHFVEVELPDEAPRTGPLWLVAQGWVHPTDSSINVAIAQGSHAAPEGLSLHVADASGRFREVRAGLGFPAGKDKTVLIDLTGLFPATGARRARLATNLEIFWDRLGWAAGRPDVRPAPRRLALVGADLAPRGYSITGQSGAASPERPRYALSGTGQAWRDLEGYYTRFGDVRELLQRVDDRYVIMNAGDELRLRFTEAPPPPPGLVRDFLFAGDGWVKDGDYNTSFSRTVLPLPTHRSARYDTPPRRLEDDPVYQQHVGDFAEYHTRYVSADRVRDALRTTPGGNRR